MIINVKHHHHPPCSSLKSPLPSWCRLLLRRRASFNSNVPPAAAVPMAQPVPLQVVVTVHGSMRASRNPSTRRPICVQEPASAQVTRLQCHRSTGSCTFEEPRCARRPVTRYTSHPGPCRVIENSVNSVREVHDSVSDPFSMLQGRELGCTVRARSDTNQGRLIRSDRNFNTTSQEVYDQCKHKYARLNTQETKTKIQVQESKCANSVSGNW